MSYLVNLEYFDFFRCLPRIGHKWVMSLCNVILLVIKTTPFWDLTHRPGNTIKTTVRPC
jgi:hypothetical protein